MKWIKQISLGGRGQGKTQEKEAIEGEFIAAGEREPIIWAGRSQEYVVRQMRDKGYDDVAMRQSL